MSSFLVISNTNEHKLFLASWSFVLVALLEEEEEEEEEEEDRCTALDPRELLPVPLSLLQLTPDCTVGAISSGKLVNSKNKVSIRGSAIYRCLSPHFKAYPYWVTASFKYLWHASSLLKYLRRLASALLLAESPPSPSLLLRSKLLKRVSSKLSKYLAKEKCARCQSGFRLV